MGGTWNAQNKVRPGVYVNFTQDGMTTEVLRRGIVTMPISMEWGQEHTVIEITPDMDTTSILGDVIDNVVPVREALKRASKVYVYRLNEASTGTKSTAILGGLTATAKYTGTDGNKISVVIEDNTSTFDVKTFYNGVLVETQENKSNVEELSDNAFIEFTGTGALEANAGVGLAGGTSAAATTADYSAYRTAMESYYWNVCALYDVTDEATKSAFKEWIERLREDEGTKVQIVIGDYATADYEGVISVKNGVVLADGTVLDATESTSWVAGATASSGTNKSLTYDFYDGAIDVDSRYTHSEIESAIEEGQFVFVSYENKARIEYDINTLHTFTADKNKMFKKNRVVRTLDAVNNDIVKIAGDYFIGKVSNNDDGRNLLKNEIVKYLQTMANNSSIQNFDSQQDVSVAQGVDTDVVTVGIAVQPVDSIEKIYMTVEVR